MKNEVIVGDCLDILRELPTGVFNTCVTSPPYFGLRDYGHDGQIGLEETPDAYVERLVEVFREVRRVLRDDGTLWLNLGDSYAATTGGVGNNPSAKSTLTTNGGRGPQPGDKYAQGNEGRRVKLMPDVPAKNLIGIPWRVAFALQADGWYLRQDIIWHKPNPMPESVRDRCTKAHEYIFLLSKSPRYYFDSEAIKEPAVSEKPAGNRRAMNAGRLGKEGWSFDPAKSIPERRNRRSVWTVSTKPFKGAHFATFPADLIEPCVLAGSPVGGRVLDPFGGSGTTGVVSRILNRSSILIEINPEYAAMAQDRIQDTQRRLL